MNRSQQAGRDAKYLFRLCLTGGRLDEARVRQVLRQVGETGNRNRLEVLERFQRLVKLESARRTATVESAVELSPELRAGIEAGLARLHGAGLRVLFEERPALIGGVRVRVGSDVYDGSVQGRLTRLEATF